LAATCGFVLLREFPAASNNLIVGKTSATLSKSAEFDHNSKSLLEKIINYRIHKND
jgi:hypothetical protein